jgi:hypothetical protein
MGCTVLMSYIMCFCIFVHWKLFSERCVFKIVPHQQSKARYTIVQPTEQTVLHVYYKIHEDGVLEWDTDEELVLKGSRKGVLLTEV